RHEHGDLVHELLEIPGRGVLVAQDRELVLDQRVIEHGEVRKLGVRHGREGTACGSVTLRDRRVDATPGMLLSHDGRWHRKCHRGRSVVMQVTLAREDARHDPPCRRTRADWTLLWRRPLERPSPDRY